MEENCEEIVHGKLKNNQWKMRKDLVLRNQELQMYVRKI